MLDTPNLGLQNEPKFFIIFFFSLNSFISINTSKVIWGHCLPEVNLDDKHINTFKMFKGLVLDFENEGGQL